LAYENKPGIKKYKSKKKRKKRDIWVTEINFKKDIPEKILGIIKKYEGDQDEEIYRTDRIARK